MLNRKKILLLRDYSGMSSQLAKGLRGAGHDVTLASIADGFKGDYGADFALDKRILGVNSVDQYINYWRLAMRGDEYDIVHFQTPFLAGRFTAVVIPQIAMLLSRGRFFSMSLAGDDYFYWTRSRDRLAYSPHSESQQVDFRGHKPYYLSTASRLINEWLAKRAHALVPACYDYAVGYGEYAHLTAHIPFCFDVDGVTPAFPASTGPVQILHSISRAGFKGSRHILEALDRLSKVCGSRVCISTFERLPYKDYKQALKNADIILDQCNSYSYGMNAVEGLALGKIVLSGAEPEALAYMKATDCPVVNIKPDAEQIFEALYNLVEQRNILPDIGRRSRKFAEEFHSYGAVIPKLLAEWQLAFDKAAGA